MTEPRVFISSVIEGFSEIREAARRGVEAAGGIPVLVEDFPSLPTSPRNACLDAIESCDYLASIVGERGGWTAPSGRLVVEEEFEHARFRSIPILAFVQDIERDADATRFAKALSEYVEGGFRTIFRTSAELEQRMKSAVAERAGTRSGGTSVKRDLTSHFAASGSGYSSMTIARFVLVPERDEEVIDPTRVASTQLEQQIYEVGHRPAVGLFSYHCPKSTRLEQSALVIDQTEPNGRHGEGEHVHLEIHEDGTLVVDANVTGRVRRGGASGLLDSMVVALEDIESVLNSSFRFADALYSLVDPYSRHERFQYNVGLMGLGYRMLERNPQPRSSMGMSMRGDSGVIAHEGSRTIARPALRDPRPEIDRTVTLLQRKASQ